MTPPGGPQVYEVELPAGGKLQLMSAEEVQMWQDSADRYRKEYALVKPNDLVMLGAILTQQLALFRAQQRLNGMEPVLDQNNVPTGEYQVVKLKASEMKSAQDLILKASKEIRELESSMGIDKKAREAGGKQTVAEYVTLAKKVAHEYGVHISKRTLAYEEVVNAVRVKIRVLDNADEEDRQYEGVSEEKIIDFLREELAKLEEVDKEFAKERGKLFVGKM